MRNSITQQPSNLKPPFPLVGILAQAGVAQAGAVVHRTRAAPLPVNPIISPASPIVVVVKKSHTNPARVPITLKTNARFRRSGTLAATVTPTSGNIRFFTAATGGNEIIVTGAGHTFTAAELSSQTGVRLFAQADGPSSNLNDFQLTLTLAPGPTPVGPPATVTMTAVLLTLDISAPRTSPGAPLTPLPQPPATPPAPGTVANDKWFGGLQLSAQDPGNNQQRAQLNIAVQPSAFTGDLVLRQVKVSGNRIAGLENKAQVFEDEIPGPKQTPAIVETPKVNPFEFPATTVPSPLGRQFFVQGRNASTVLRDTGFQLGIKGVENDGDRVAITVAVAPVITLDSPIVVVKKPHTNPARRVVTLRASTTFSRSGTLTRSPSGPPIRLFDRATGGNEIVVTGTGHTFTGAELSANAGVRLFAESTIPSGAADDYQLTLTLAPGATPVGAPQTVRMTAVELTLDVALSRTSPGAAPPVMSANDKINTGRFVQVRDPGFSHERAMIILRPPNPPIPLTVELASLTAQVQAFGIEAPAAGQAPQPSPATFPSALLTATPGGMQLFVEGTTFSTVVRDTGFRFGIQGLENEGDRVLMTAVQFDATLTASGVVAASSFVRFGLWDHAFDPATGNLRNGAADADHFIGADSRRFFFRVRDVNAVGTPQMEWRTVKADGTADHAPVGQPLQLRETAPNSHLFFSRPVFMVTDDIDRQLTGSGLSVADVGLLTPRIRKVTVDATHPIDGKLAATYTPSAGQVLRIAAVLFSRSPEERRRLRVHLVNVRGSVGGTGVLQAARRNTSTELFHSIYAVCGIFAEVDEILIDPPASCLAWPTVYPGNAAFLAGPIVEGFRFQAGNLVASTSQSDIITVVRNLPAFNVNDIYIVFINRILSSPLPAPPVVVPPAPAPAVAFVLGGGEAFPDSFTAAGSTARGFAFVSVLSTNNLAEVHEATHMTTNLSNAAGGHYDLGSPPPAAGPGNIDGRNLMHRHPLISNGNVRDSKRLWNTQVTNSNYSPPLVIPPQIDAIRSSRFIRNF